MMMKRTGFKIAMASTILFSGVLGHVSATNAAEFSKAVAPSIPIMTDNLLKFGLIKEKDFPITVTSGGLSYTLHKIMIYDINSKEAKALSELYRYPNSTMMIYAPKYFIWTKITITNHLKKTISPNSETPYNPKWILSFDASSENGRADAPIPIAKKNESNSKEALYNFKLKPGKSLTTYQAFYYEGDFKQFKIDLAFSDIFTKLVVAANAD